MVSYIICRTSLPCKESSQPYLQILQRAKPSVFRKAILRDDSIWFPAFVFSMIDLFYHYWSTFTILNLFISMHFHFRSFIVITDRPEGSDIPQKKALKTLHEFYESFFPSRKQTMQNINNQRTVFIIRMQSVDYAFLI